MCVLLRDKEKLKPPREKVYIRPPQQNISQLQQAKHKNPMHNVAQVILPKSRAHA